MCDNIEYHWNNSIKEDYPNAKKILLLCDGGGSNSCLHYVVKEHAIPPLNNKLSNIFEIYVNFMIKYIRVIGEKND